MVTIAIMVGGALAVAAAWWVVATARASVFTAMAIALGAAAGASLATGRVDLSPDVRPLVAAAAGTAAGAVLYLATLAFVLVVRRWSSFGRHVSALYERRRGYPLGTALVLAVGVVAPAEEIFWRGLFQERVSEAAGWVAGGAFAWGVYVMANAASGSLPILAGAVVSGAAWTALAMWTRGVLASIACHAVWTALMIARPPGGPAGPRSGVAEERPVPAGDP